MQRKSRVLAVVRHPVGGIRTYLKYTYGHLDPAKYAFVFVMPRGEEAELIAKDLRAFELKIISVDGNIERSLLTAVRGEIKSGQYDLIHSHGLTAGLIAIVANLRLGLPHVVTSHDVFRPEQFSSISSPLKKFLMAQFLRRATIIHSVTTSAQENLVHYLPSLRGLRSLRVVQNGIFVEPFKQLTSPADNLRQRINAAPEQVVFGFFGRFMPQKGFEDIIEAVRLIALEEKWQKRIKVLAVNDGAFIREYKEKIRSLGLESYFHFYGFADNVLQLMSQVDAVLMPSLWEACGLVAMEAMAAGKPLLATEIDGLKDVLRDSPAIRVRAHDAVSLSGAMKRVTINLHSLDQGAKSFAEEARRRFDVKHAAAGLETLFTEATSQKVA